MMQLLDGIRIIDFCWVGAGSYTTKLLADLGADVIKVESSKKLDSLRLARPFKNGIPGINRSGYFADRNTSKKSITINLKSKEGQALARQLIQEADAVTNNFTPGVMDKLGLGYETLKKINPSIIYLSMSMQGSEGPKSPDLGYGLTIAAVTSLFYLSGLPDRVPAGTGTNFPDHIPNPTHAAFALIAALRHKRRTGQGQRIDIAQVEPMISMLAESVMDFYANGSIQKRSGNRDKEQRYLPQGVFPCQGDDRWIAISIAGDPQWQNLCAVLGIDSAHRHFDETQRKENQAAIEELLAQKTVRWNNLELATSLQEKGIAAGPVYDAKDIFEHDEQLKHREHWVHFEHPEVGNSVYNNTPFRFSRAQ